MGESWLELEGKTVIVTGAASGIGKAVAQEFLNVGANVVISDMAEKAPEMDAEEGKLLYVRTDEQRQQTLKQWLLKSKKLMERSMCWLTTLESISLVF